FHRETRVSEKQTLVVSFKVVEVRAGPMDLLRYIVPCPVGKVLAEAGLANHGAGRIVGLETPNRSPRGERLLHRPDRGVTCVADGLEHLLLPLRRFPSHLPRPGD